MSLSYSKSLDQRFPTRGAGQKSPAKPRKEALASQRIEKIYTKK